MSLGIVQTGLSTHGYWQQFRRRKKYQKVVLVNGLLSLAIIYFSDFSTYFYDEAPDVDLIVNLHDAFYHSTVFCSPDGESQSE